MQQLATRRPRAAAHACAFAHAVAGIAGATRRKLRQTDRNARKMARRTASIILALVLASVALPAAAARRAPPRHAPAGPSSASPHPRQAKRPVFRPARTTAAAEARRLGEAVGQGCKGRADIARGEHEWVVLCSNGKTYVLDMTPAQHAAAPATECSLAGIGPQPACFSE